MLKIARRVITLSYIYSNNYYKGVKNISPEQCFHSKILFYPNNKPWIKYFSSKRIQYEIICVENEICKIVVLFGNKIIKYNSYKKYVLV